MDEKRKRILKKDGRLALCAKIQAGVAAQQDLDRSSAAPPEKINTAHRGGRVSFRLAEII